MVLLGLLPPLLYAAAIGTSLVDFNANRRPILLLSVGLVAFTTVGVAVVVHAILPEVGWAAAFAIGAVVAPPDAVAATAIGRRIGLPRRIVTILEGESLLNDATALVALRTAIAAIGSTAAMAPAWEIGLDFLLAAGGGLLIGFAVFILIAKIRKHVTDPVLDTGDLAGGAVRDLHRGREDPRLRRGRGRRGRPAARPQGAHPADRAVPDRRADELAHLGVHAREHGLPADRPPGRLAGR